GQRERERQRCHGGEDRALRERAKRVVEVRGRHSGGVGGGGPAAWKTTQPTIGSRDRILETSESETGRTLCGRKYHFRTLRAGVASTYGIRRAGRSRPYWCTIGEPRGGFRVSG